MPRSQPLFLAALAVFALQAGTAHAACRDDVARFQKLIDGDLKTGFIGKEIYGKANSELAAAGKLCKAGQEDAATAAVRAVRVRHGYPAGSNQNLPQ
jgi:hypothetical protein